MLVTSPSLTPKIAARNQPPAIWRWCSPWTACGHARNPTGRHRQALNESTTVEWLLEVSMTTHVNEHRRIDRTRRHAPRLLRLPDRHPGAGQPLRRRHRRPPVDPRRPRTRQGRPLRRTDRPRLPHALAHPGPAGRRDEGRRRHHGRQLRHQQGSLHQSRCPSARRSARARRSPRSRRSPAASRSPSTSSSR